jgi:SPFH domain / Band 7 family
MIDSYFRNLAQDYEALDFQDNRVEIQRGAEKHIKAALNAYGVQAISTLINEIDPPDELEELLKRRRIFEEQRKTIEAEKLTEQERQGLIEEQQRTKAQVELVKAQQNLQIAELNAQATIKKVEADAEAKRLMDDVDLNTRRQQLDMDADPQERLRNIEINELQQRILALSPELYTNIESEKAWSHALAQLKRDMPEIFIGGSSTSPEADALQAGTMQFARMDMLRDMLRQREPVGQKNLPQQEENIKFQAKGTLINISGVTGEYVSQIPASQISATVTKTINHLPDYPQSEQPTIKKLLTQLQAVIEGEKELTDEDKIEALEQVKTLAELGQNPTKENMKKPAKVAINILKLISNELPNTSNLVEHFNQLLPAITHLFYLGQ